MEYDNIVFLAYIITISIYITITTLITPPITITFT